MPEAFDGLDIRADPKKWLEMAVNMELERIFLWRFQAERFINGKQLRAFDNQVLKNLDRKKFKEALESHLKGEIVLSSQRTEIKKAREDTPGSEWGERMKSSDDKSLEKTMNLIKNKDLLARKFAFDVMCWKKRNEDPDELVQHILHNCL